MVGPKGEVVTFYSFTGGSGRTLALANVACFLARRCAAGEKVLAIDWSLEAPGLHRVLPVPEGSPASSGLLELFAEAASA